MKNKFVKLSILAGSLFAVAFSSCSKKIDEAYANPNAAIRQPVENILPGVIGGFTWFSSTQGTTYGVVTDGTFVGRYIQYWGINSTGDTWGQHSMLGGAVDNGGSVWATVYYGQGANVNRIIEWGTEEQKWDYVGAAQVIRAWGWLQLTLEYEYGILRQAWEKGRSTFTYQDQPELLDSCRAVALRGIENLNRTDGNVSQANFAIGDAFFNNGDREKWKKFAYGIIARSYICLSYKNLFAANSYALADSAIKYANLAQQTNADNPTVKVTGPPINGQINFWGPGRGNFNTYRQGSYVARLMNGDDTTAFAGLVDPRAWYMLSENLNGTFKGLLPWSGNATMTNDYPKSFWRYAPATTVGSTTYPVYPPSTATPPASWGDSCRYLYDNTSPWPMMTASEMKFIIAEAELRRGNHAAAKQAYVDGISLNFDMLTQQYPKGVPAGKQITPAIKAAYLADTRIVPVSPTDLTLTKIMNQKYIALFVWGALETWVDMRKFHYIDIDPATNKKVYAGFTLPTGANMVSTNLGQPTYRMRPRFNSEYLYNIPELTRIGAYQFPNYNTFIPWFAVQ
jgi:hypothetical protein